MKKTTIYRRPMDENLFEEELTIEALSAMGNPLEQLSALVDFEMFRPELEDILVKKDCKSTAGRPQFDVVLMFKVIFLQRYYGLGDKQIQYQIIDRTSFRQFLGIHTVDEIPDEKTVWHVKNILSKAGTFDALFDKFRSYLDSKGLSFNEGKIIDASFVEAPKQRNTREENERKSPAMAKTYGMTSHTRSAIRIPMHAGPRSAARSTLAISSMPRQTRRPNSLRNTQPQMPASTTPMS